jgi:hypothetical protein
MQVVAGAVFALFAFAVCGMAPAPAADIPIALRVAAASVTFAVVVGSLGAPREPGSWEWPALPHPRFVDAWQAPGARAHLVRYIIALLGVGLAAPATLRRAPLPGHGGGQRPGAKADPAAYPWSGPNRTPHAGRP